MISYLPKASNKGKKLHTVDLYVRMSLRAHAQIILHDSGDLTMVLIQKSIFYAFSYSRHFKPNKCCLEKQIIRMCNCSVIQVLLDGIFLALPIIKIGTLNGHAMD